MKIGSISFFILTLVFGFLPVTTKTVAEYKSYNIVEAGDIKRDCGVKNSAFQAGEKAVYTVYYKIGFVWIPAGEVTFSVEEDENYYHLKAYGRTYNSYDRLFRVRDTYESKVDKKTLLPVTATRDINQGSYSKTSEMTFDYEKRKVKAYHGRSADRMQTDFVDMDRCLRDVLSIVYYTRNLDVSSLRPRDVVELNVGYDEKVYDIGMRFLKREENYRIRRAGGNFDLLKFSPSVIAGGVFNEGDEMLVWVSDDKNRIPIQIESPLRVGSVRVVLDSYENLKHPFTSKK
ncbi:MAG: DUF3108 domain-containing protein [Saprospirales bacterium]|nr:MAG: DUF3108 domain-containing protein [Saprospirales bacterium]